MQLEKLLYHDSESALLLYHPCIEVYTDKIDPRKDPLGHLFYDAPEVIIGLTCAAIGGYQVGTSIFKKTNSKNLSKISGLGSSLLFGYLGYSLTKKIKQLKGG